MHRFAIALTAAVVAISATAAPKATKPVAAPTEASTPTPATKNADPFGLELAVATLAQTRAKYGSELSDAGTNAINGGRMLKATNPSVGPEGLQDALLVFDKEERLVAVQMTLPKHGNAGPVTEMANQLRKKYAEQSRNIPSVGNAMVRFERGNSVILLEAPHMSFAFTVTYLTKDFQNALKTAEAEKAKAKERRTEGSV